jgi:RNA polymerase sigma factor (sigma-70 family)
MSSRHREAAAGSAAAGQRSDLGWEPFPLARCLPDDRGGEDLHEADELDERTAIAQARNGEVGGYEYLLARHTAIAHRTAVLLGAGDEADDVVQEAFVKAFQRLGDYRGESGFRRWLLAIVGNETRNLHRSRRRRDGLVLRAVVGGGRGPAPVDPSDSAEATERRQHLVAALRRLDHRERDVLVCRYLLDLSESETAATLDLSKGTVKSRAFRALAKLRVVLDVKRSSTGIAREVAGG